MTKTILLIAAAIVFAVSAHAADLTVEQAWKQIPAYKEGESRAALLLLEIHIGQASAKQQPRQQAAARLATVLQNGTDDAKLFACQQLARVGSAVQVPAVATLLAKGDVRSVQMACFALVGIGGDAACRELRNALGKAPAAAQPDIITALGTLQNADSATVLAGRLGNGGGPVAEAAAWALGEIGNTAAAEALLKLGPKPASVSVTGAQLRCIQRLAQSNNGALAQQLCDALWQADLSAPQRGAVLQGMIAAGHAQAAVRVIEAMASDQPRLAGAAANLLPQAAASGDVGAVLATLDALSPATQARVLDVLAANGEPKVLPVAVASLKSADAPVRLAATRAIGLVGDGTHVEILARLAAASTGQMRETAVASLARLRADGVDGAILTGLKDGDDKTSDVFIDVAVQRGSAGLVPVLWELAASKPVLRKSVFRALGKVATGADSAKLIQHLQTDLGLSSRRALEDAIAAVGRRSANADKQLQSLAALWRSAAPAAAKASVPRILARLGGEDALAIVQSALKQDNAELRLEAIRALAAWPDIGATDGLVALAENKEDKIAHTLAVRGLMRLVDQKIGSAADQLDIVEQLTELSDDEAVKDWAKKRRDGMVGGKADRLALTRVPERSARRTEELAKSAEKGWRIVAYLDCGPDQRDGAKRKPRLRITAGKPWVWAGSERHADLRAGTIAFGSVLGVEASGLDPQKSYRVGLTWWDYDGNGRVQSVRLSGQQVLKPTPLPSYKKGKQAPATLVLDAPGSAYKSGKMPIEIRQSGGPNAVLSEIWLLESDAKPKEEPVVKPKPRDPNAKRILLQTGEDYKGHKWRLTTPALEQELSKDTRLAVDVEEDLAFLRSPKLHEYAAVVMHFKNYDPKLPGREGYDNLASFVEKGGGLVLVHFAGGAFQEFKGDFVKLAGQVWNPKLRGHDPFGEFTVNFEPVDHPVTRGMSDFRTTDELYTCLEGDTPMTVLASAVSKVDRKAYPMVFVFTYGKGRVLHCPLGHNAPALSNAPVAELFRRATAWVARSEPVARK